MPQQPETISPSLPASPAHLPGPELVSGPDRGRSGPVALPQADGGKPQRIPRWLERAELFLRVLLSMYIGIAVCCAPWLKMFWDRNPLFALFPTVSIYAANGAVRGLISGLGLLNLWFALREAIRHGKEE